MLPLAGHEVCCSAIVKGFKVVQVIKLNVIIRVNQDQLMQPQWATVQKMLLSYGDLNAAPQAV